MRASTARTRRRAAAVVVTAAAACFAAFACFGRSHASAIDADGAVAACECDGFRYEYNVLTGGERLFELKGGAPVFVDVLGAHPEEAAKCRETIERDLGVQRLEELRARRADAIRRLHAVGYL